MDTALSLRLSVEKQQIVDDSEISILLEKSELIKKLTKDFEQHPLFSVFRIMGLSEIPFCQRLPYAQKLMDYMDHHVATPEGFSCLGGVKEIVPCYNAMVLEAYSRMGAGESPQAQAAVNWIKQYQLFDRGHTTSWPYKGICKHGGCLGSIPCYIGIGKTVRALITYSEYVKQTDEDIETMILQGTSYMLRHNMYQRLSNRAPISPHITDIMMPQNYALSLTDLIYIAGKRKLREESGCAPLFALLKEKEIADHTWKIDYLYTYKGYVGFESRRKASEWISFLFPLWIH